MTPEEHREDSLPEDHPRYQSLTFRHKIIDGMKSVKTNWHRETSVWMR